MQLYLDCFSGISGDMFLAALLDLGLDKKAFIEEIKKLPLENYDIKIKKDMKKGISGTNVFIDAMEGHHPHRGLADIYAIIDKSSIKDQVKQTAKEAFLKLAKAEGRIHGKSPDKIHFHEVGAVDSILDIVGACILLDMLKVDKIISSPVNVGSGFVDCAHGTLPVPAPATLELLKGIPVYSRGDGELTTPTGALILSMFVDQFGPIPEGAVRETGYGLGKRDTDAPNVLRTILIDEQKSSKFDNDEVIILEANIDDMNPELFDNVIDNLFNKGALDVFLQSIIMKKSRLGIKLSCIAPKDKKEILAETILRETTTLGVREYEVRRTKLFRHEKVMTTSLGPVRVKISSLGDDILRTMPEYDDIKSIAKENQLPALKVYQDILKEIVQDI